MSKKITFEDFYERVKLKHGDSFTVSPTEFISMKHPIRVFCNKHRIHIDTHAASHVTHHNPCKQCVRDKKFTDYVPKVLNALKQYFPNFELKSEISDFNCEVTLLCPRHGEFVTLSDKIIFSKNRRRMNCPRCGLEQSSESRTGLQRVSFTEFTERFVERYGSKLTLISGEEDYQNFNSLLWVTCSDTSHPEFEKSAKDLLRYQGCKHCNESWGERLTRIALENLGIKYEQEKRFATCRDRKELPFDFWLPDFSTLIEFQGKQHEVSAERFGGKKSLQATQRRDKIKREWATKNGINLVYIDNYKDVSKTILDGLTPTTDYDPIKVLTKITEQEQKWTSEKWQKYLKKLTSIHKRKYDFSDTKWSWGQRKVTYIVLAP